MTSPTGYNFADVSETAMERVRYKFNPSGNKDVDNIKLMAAALITMLEALAKGAPGAKARCAAIAITNIEQGAMWAVKAATALAAEPVEPTEPKRRPGYFTTNVVGVTGPIYVPTGYKFPFSPVQIAGYGDDGGMMVSDAAGMFVTDERRRTTFSSADGGLIVAWLNERSHLA